MPYVVADRVKETTTTTGTGNITLAGAATGFKTFNTAIGVSNTTTYVIVNATGSEWEVGLGTLTAGTTLVRTVVFANSANTTSQINFTAGTKSVFVSMSAAPFNGNTTLGTSQSFSPNARSFTTVIGFGAGVTHDYGTAVGQYSTAGNNGVALGGGNTASALQSTAVGTSNTTQGSYAVAIGSTNSAPGQGAVAIGYSTTSGTAGLITDSVAIGSYSSAPGDRAIAIGQYASAVSASTAVGQGNTSSGGFSTAVGSYANATNSYSTALGGSVTADQVDQLAVRVRVNPSVLPSSYTLKYDIGTYEIYASNSGGGGGGVTQIIAGPGISITSSGPSGTGIVTISAGGAPAGFDWFTRDPSPIDGTIALPTNFTPSPSGPADLVLAGFTNGSWSPSGPWFTGFPGGWFGNMNYVIDIDWPFVTTPAYSYAPGTTQGFAFNYVQYPAGHSNTNRQNVNGSAGSWFSAFGASYGTGGFPAFGSSRKLFGVFVIPTGPTDLSGVVSVNPTYPGTTFTAYYDPYSGVTVVAFQNLVDSEVDAIVGGGAAFIAWGGSPYSYYGHVWYEYS